MKIDMSKLRTSNSNRKLDEEKVTRIKELIREGYSCNSIAKAFHVAAQTVYKIRDNVIWKHVPWPKPVKLKRRDK